MAAVPDGWDGYFALYDGSPGADPGCTILFPGSTAEFLGNDDLQNDGPASCSSCGCGSPAGQTCKLPDLVVLDAQCGQQACDGFF